MSKTNTGLVAYCRAQLGRPYWYGTFGQTATASLLANKSRQYPSQFTGSRMDVAKSRHMGQRVHDCVGLIKGYLWSETPDSRPVYRAAQDVDANAMLKMSFVKGDIASMPETPGLLVFFPGHVGVYAGRGKVIEARGFDFGVVETVLSERPFKSFAKCPFIEYPSDGAQTAPEITLSLPELQIGSRGGSVTCVQRLLLSHMIPGASGRPLETDGLFGNETDHAVKSYQKTRGLEADGVVGQKTWKALLSE